MHDSPQSRRTLLVFIFVVNTLQSSLMQALIFMAIAVARKLPIALSETFAAWKNTDHAV